MKEDMLEVLIYLFENYVINGDSFEPGQDELAKELIGAGFPNEEVDKAFVWLDGLLTSCESNDNKQSWQSEATTSIRFYHRDETLRLKSEGQSLLSRLVSAGLLDQYSRETVIERVMALESAVVTLDHIKWVVLMVLSNRPGFAEIADWAEVVVSDDFRPVIH